MRNPGELSLSLVICTYQRPEPIRNLLNAISEDISPPDEVIVIDGSPGSGTHEVVSGFIEKIQGLIYYQVDQSNRGLTRQRNVGIQMAKSDIIAFLDDDTIPCNGYFSQLRECFVRHPDAIGVGGLIVGVLSWSKTKNSSKNSLSEFRWQEWAFSESVRWRVRNALGLGSALPPGWIPEHGHGRSPGYPPDTGDHKVEHIMGGASAWKKRIFSTQRFSTYFEGYGLYEDLEFCIRASREGSLFVCTAAQLEHHHHQSGRPNHYQYGIMVVRNGWLVWRLRWSNPSVKNIIKWWLIEFLLTLLRLVDIRKGGFLEALGRFRGMVSIILKKPSLANL